MKRGRAIFPGSSKKKKEEKTTTERTGLGERGRNKSKE